VQYEEGQAIAEQLSKLTEELEFLRDENSSLTKGLKEMEDSAKNDILFYKQLAEDKFKECSSLAEEIICLRTDLDRSHSNYLRMQRQQSMVSINDDPH
jgi:uncharacterized protein (DUF342 family)